jgi:hypothetical protein
MPERKPNPAADLAEYADVGDAVNWFAGGDPSLTPLLGMVISKSPGGGANTANLTVATFTGSGFAVQEGVMHMTNPLARRKGGAGGWQHRPLDLLFRRFLFALGAMKWDGDESYGANPAFDHEALGAAVAALGASKPGKPQTGKPEGGAQTG